MFSRKNVAPLLAEVLGTAILTFSVLAITRSAIGISYFVAIGVGLTVVLTTATLASTSGAHFNPAVTFGLWTIRKIDTLKAVLYIVAQFVGALAALRLFMYLSTQPVTSMVDGKFDWRVLVAEAVGTFVLTMGIAAATYQKFEGGKLAAVAGGSLGLGILLAGVASNGILNPAVALGAQSWSKAYIAGPLVGSLVGVNFYALAIAGDKLGFVKSAKVSAKSSIKTTKKSTSKKRSKR